MPDLGQYLSNRTIVRKIAQSGIERNRRRPNRPEIEQGCLFRVDETPRVRIGGTRGIGVIGKRVQDGANLGDRFSRGPCGPEIRNRQFGDVIANRQFLGARAVIRVSGRILLMEPFRVRIEPPPGRFEPAQGVDVALFIGIDHGFERGPDLSPHFVRLAVPVMQVQRKHAEPDLIEPPLHDIERRPFFGDEQHFLPTGNRPGQQIRNCLGFAGARWTFENECPTIHGFSHGRQLR